MRVRTFRWSFWYLCPVSMRPSTTNHHAAPEKPRRGLNYDKGEESSPRIIEPAVCGTTHKTVEKIQTNQELTLIWATVDHISVRLIRGVAAGTKEGRRQTVV